MTVIDVLWSASNALDKWDGSEKLRSKFEKEAAKYIEAFVKDKVDEARAKLITEIEKRAMPICDGNSYRATDVLILQIDAAEEATR